MSDLVFSIVTIDDGNKAGLKRIDRMLEIQLQPPPFEWILVEENGDFVSALNHGLDRAHGRYVWFLRSGDCLSDAFSLKTIHDEIRSALSPGFLYGAARCDGAIRVAKDFSALSRGAIAPLQAVLWRRDVLNGMMFDAEYRLAPEYAMMLRLQENNIRIRESKLVLCDMDCATLDDAARHEEFIRIRRELLQMPEWKNNLLAMRDKAELTLRRLLKKS